MIIENFNLSTKEYNEIKRILEFSKHDPPEIEDLWKIMDIVWDELGCNNLNLDWDKIAEYYKHPVWILNGIFIENHELSLQHRHAISDWIIHNKLTKVLDFGGGTGTLACIISKKNSEIIIDIYEPYPSQYAILKTQNYRNIDFVNSLNEEYECLVSTDVLEHLIEPLETFSKMIEVVKPNGFLIIANHFYPSIKCHLPSTFHFRYTFNQFAKSMGLKVIDICHGSHATIYQKISNKSFDWKKLKKMEASSKFWFLINQIKHDYLGKWKNRLVRLFKDPIETAKSLNKKIQ